MPYIDHFMGQYVGLFVAPIRVKAWNYYNGPDFLYISFV
jgi:hypothetical protein